MLTHRIAATAAPTRLQAVRRVVQRAFVGTVAVLGLSALANPASAQIGGPGDLSQGLFEVRPFAGAFIGTGDQRDLLVDAFMTGVQGSWRIIPAVAMTGTFGWSPNRDQTIARERLDIFQYDVGVEARANSFLSNGTVDFSPFIGAGLGGRTYSYRDHDADTKTHFNGYGAVGGDLGVGRVGLRLEARDYVSRFTPLSGDGDTEARNDITLAAGLYLRF
jgi:hypothetical protein